MESLLGGDLNPILGFCFPLFSRVLPWGISIRVETSGSERKQSVANCGRSKYKVSMCFDDSFHFHEDVRIPFAYALKVAASCFDNAILYSFEQAL
jgi:hypothetical protein